MFFVGLVIGLMWGAIFMIVLRWASGRMARARWKRQQRRAARRNKREPLPQLWATGAGYPSAGATGDARRAPGRIAYYGEGERERQDCYHRRGPREW